MFGGWRKGKFNLFTYKLYSFTKKRKKNGWMYREMRWMCLMMHVDKDKCEGNGTITSSFFKKKYIFFNLIVKWTIYSHPFMFSSSFSFLFHFDCKRDHLFPSFSRFLIFFPSFSNLFAKGIIVDLVFYSMRSQSMTWLAFNLFGENLIFRKKI